MADKKPSAHDTKNATRSGAAAKGGATPTTPIETPKRPAGWRDAWPIPALIIGVALLGLGVKKWASMRPGPDFPGAIASVESLIAAGEYEKALATLNDPIGRNLSQAGADEETHKQFYLLSADALAFAQKSKGLNVKANHEQVVDLYETARRRYHAGLDGRRTVNLAESLLALGRREEAMTEIRNIPEALASERRGLLRRLIDERFASEGSAAADEKMMDLLSRFRDDPSASVQDRAWAVARQTRLRLDAGFPEESVRRLLPEIQRLDSRDTPEAGELLLLLGRAYYQTGEVPSALEQLQRAEDALPESSESYAEARVLLGRIAQSHSQLEEAKEAFTFVTQRFAKSSIAVRAWLGLGEVESELGDSARSLEGYEKCVDAVRAGWLAGPGNAAAPAEPVMLASAKAAPSDAFAAEVDASLAQRHRDHLLRGDFETARKYAVHSERLFPADKAPAGVALRLAETSRAAAVAIIPAELRSGSEPADLSGIDPVSREEAKRHFYEAAMAYQRHAKAALISDPEAARESLWLAADCYDQSGEQDRAVDVFAQYIRSSAESPKRLLAQYRMARALQSMGDYKKAIPLFEDIIETSPVSDEATLSLIPLAQSYLLASNDADHEKAEARLLQIVEGKQFEPSAGQFRTAVVELGRMYRRIGDYPKAIERLNEAVARYPDLEKDPALRSALADSHRLSASAIGEQLKSAMPQNERSRLTRLRRQRLEEALAGYDRVRELLEVKDPRRTSELDKVTLRNAMFYRGDCAFDLGQFHKDDDRVSRGYFQQAIRFYDTAAQRYAEDPASLGAMMQIVSAYAALGQWTEAQTAQNRAKARLKELPAEAWTNAEGPMDRAHWERWLDSSVTLEKMAAKTTEAPTP